MANDELPLWLILLFMPLVLPLVARPFVRRGWTKSIHHMRRGRMLGISYIFAHIWKLLVFIIAYYVTGVLLAVMREVLIR